MLDAQGDFVDRGHFSLETFSLLLAFKARCVLASPLTHLSSHKTRRYPDRVTLLRGNHESRSITQVYGFYGALWSHRRSESSKGLSGHRFDAQTSVSESTATPTSGGHVATSSTASTSQRCAPTSQSITHLRVSDSPSLCGGAQIIDSTVLCVHGGLSPEIRTLDQIRVLSRAQEIPHEGAFCGPSSSSLLQAFSRGC